MSIDGSFNLQSSLQRFLARCPNLQSNPRLKSLSQKGENLTEDEAVSATAELFLNEKYTIPIMGCFRPIARRIVDKAVELLSLARDLKSSCDDSAMEVDDDDDDNAYFIEAYIRSGNGLKLHETACVAFSRALDLAPFVLRSVVGYFNFSPPPFQRLLGAHSASQLIEKDGTHLLVAMRASFRLLQAEPQVFSELWDWSSFLDLVQNSTNVVSDNNPGLNEMGLDIKWCAIQIISVTLKMSDRVTMNFGMDVVKSFACLLRWEEFCQDVSLEKAGMYLDMDVMEMGKLVDKDSEFNHELCLKSIDFGPLNTLSLHSTETNSLNKIRKQITRNAKPLKRPFARTPAVKNSFEMVLMAVSQKWPVLLYGPTGAGKTALINELAQVSGNRVLSIHLDEQMDGKTLIGSYVCTEQPGEFRWQPGSLTQAIMNGFWVVFEDIDKAPSDVHSILLPLLEGASSFVTDRGEAIRVTESFRLFATVSNLTNDPSHKSEGKSMLGVLWRRVMISPATDEELSAIVNAWYGDLSAVVKNLIETYEMIRYSHSHHRVASRSYDRISLRDLLKWCKRIDSLGFSFQGLSLSAHERKMIYQEAVDTFAASSASYENRLVVMKVIAKMWGVPEIEAETSISFSKPVVQEMQSGFQIGRVILRTTDNMLQKPTRSFVDIRSSLQVLERIACSVKHNEPVLLVGETGTGKTTLVQNLASRLDQPLTVLNLSQQSDVGDLLGGVKPTDPQFICVPLYNEFMELFPRTFSKTVNPAILGYLRRHKNDKNWKKVLEVLEKGHQKVLDLTRTEAGVPGSGKRKRPLSEEIFRAWEQFSDKLKVAHRQIDASSCMAFSFVEGAFVTSLKKGHWILLDEINLAPPETLQRIMGVLEGENGSLCLTERGDVDYIERHSDFRLFACMNPATDAGKRDLPFSVRSRFTEYFVDEILSDEDLTLFIKEFLDEGHRNRELVSKIVHFYKAAKKESEDRLQDGANQKPQFSLRSLYRALEYVKKAERKFGFQKALYDGFCMFFLTLLDGPSAKFMNSIICSYLLGGSMPQNVPFDSYLIVAESCKSDPFLDAYILTSSVKEHLRNLSRAILIKRYPVLLQGPTSSGKTSLVRYLATVTGHEFVRINNHEHTDLQEYLGSYVTDASGKLVFQEGVLVKAVRSGCWIVLDELNLAPSDVLEALNRLLDDNRELFVPELQETIKAHPDFMLFATQNPPTVYGGRKILSRAFRNRFVEIHVDEIPEDELSTILEKRCKIPETYAKKMVDVMKDLQMHRQSSKIFAGKHGFITPRDLFRWANRFQAFGSSYEDLAKDGYFLLAERLRDENEKKVVQEILEKRLRVKLVEADLYKQQQVNGSATVGSCYGSGVQDDHGNVIWTKSMQRLYFLVERCYKLREPVLLVGETGGGKTTICQLLSAVLKTTLHISNCHQYTETSDFLGGFYPVRDRSVLSTEFKNVVEQLMLSNVVLQFPGATLSTDIGEASSTFSQLSDITNTYRKRMASQTDVPVGDLKRFEQMKMSLIQLYQKWQTIFTWHDGPLVQAMKNGDLFLVDEISLADDSVLERLNSVLEPERKLSLAEKGGPVLENISSHPNFFLLATMNPGGDYGKKELSPALRNRLTEIWVPAMTDSNELRSIALSFISTPLSYTVEPLLKFWEWFRQFHTSRMLTVRDLLSWIDFMNITEKSFESPNYGFLHGAFLVLLDGLSLGTGMSRHEAGQLREQCLSFLLECLKPGVSSSEDLHLPTIESFGWGENGRGRYNATANIVQSDKFFGITPFCIHKGEDDCKPEGFEFLAPTTCRNAMRVLRAMQLMKPVLLEGSPGVGKTSLIVALGKFSGHRVVRINLSEQTDIMDLLGSDLPVEDAKGMKFAWSDGILLQALKNGDWVLLDELNLAPQSVLEGLNAILDHRAEVFIPELGRTYKCPPSFRIFACQNPSCQGGGRKGLPKSFLNRFTKVYVDELVEDDYLYICSSLHPSIPKPLLSKLILFNKRLYVDTMISRKFGQDGSPWEFNLRDVLRCCQIIEGTPEISKADCFLSVVYIQRLRTAADRQEAVKLYEEVFRVKPSINPYPRLQLNPRYLIVGNTSIERNHVQPSDISKSQLKILPRTRHSLEAVMHCVQHQWLCILVGPSASGKTSLVRLLAQLTGNALNELNLSSATDISELLGCFEQYNAFRNIQSAISQIGRYINEYCSRTLESSLEVLILESKGLVSRWFAFVSTIYGKPLSSSASAYAENWESGSESSLGSLIKIIEQLKTGFERYQLPVSWSIEDLNKVLKIVIELLENSKKQAFPAKFEWVTGLLIRAIECGEWIVLENANLCNPTVLDRINSLVEPSGSITVNECGLVDGRPVVLQANRKFRLFLTVNPRYGEVSRAMRNRGVEVFMMQPDWVHDGEKGYNRKEMEMHDLKRFLVLSGIPSSMLVETMAEAHIFARDVGADFGVRITLLELSRWVQLLQQLLLNGNMSLWSLQVSWEHTYLSSLGESGRSAVDHAKNSFLSASNLCKSDAYLKTSLSLPGGWATPLQLRDFIWHSRQACVKQNCMYLEYLGNQFASYELSSSHYRGLAMKDYAMDGAKNKFSIMEANKTPYPSVMPLEMILQVLFPKTSYQRSPGRPNLLKFDQALVHKMLLFAANWTIEQATEGDFKLYLLFLQWYSSQLHPYCRFFESYLKILKQELEHSIWNCIFDCRRELTSHYGIDVDMEALPVLSLKLLNLAGSDGNLQGFKIRLHRSIKCVDLLHRSFQQWNAEDDCSRKEENQFSPVLESLRVLEKEVFSKLVDSQCFNRLFQNFSSLIEHHSVLWDGIVSSSHESLILAWRSLEKDLTKLKSSFPEFVKDVLVQSHESVNLSPWIFQYVKPMLWVYGGHPFLPSSWDTYSMMQQLLNFCQSVWPTNTISWKQGSSVGTHIPVKAIVSANVELRSLAMQGVCMSSFLTRKGDEDDSSIVQQLEEMHQILLRRFEHEIEKSEAMLVSSDHSSLKRNLSACCDFFPEEFHTKLSYSSWQDMFCLFNSTSFFLDMDLLKVLSNAVLEDEKLHKVLSNTSDLLETSLSFSLRFSSRPPMDFIPHQAILWALDAWESVNAVNTKIASSVLDMWFKWHSVLWTRCPQRFEVDISDSSLLHMLFKPAKTTTINRILKDSFPVKEFEEHCLKLRVVSANLWNDSPPKGDLPDILLSTACCLFQQIVFAHEKSFGKEIYAEIKSSFGTIRGTNDKLEKLQSLRSLIATSNHNRLTSLMQSFISPLLDELYLQNSSHDFLENLGRAWLHVGGLRFHLLLNPDDLDPAIRYSVKHSQIVEKISLLQLEIKVRQECESLVGSSSSSDVLKQKQNLLEKMEEDRKGLQRKVVFRHDASKFTRLKSECAKFIEDASKFTRLKPACATFTASYAEPTKNMSTSQLINESLNWQETATSFIYRLSEEYAAYVDIIQPIQVAVYEMKLGLALVVSSALQKAFLAKIEGTIDHNLETIYSFMRFPRTMAANLNSDEACNKGSDHLDNDVSADILAMDIRLLKNLCTILGDSVSDTTVSFPQLNATLYHNVLVRGTHRVVNSLLIGFNTFKFLSDIFERFASLWMSMKVQTKAKEDDDARNYKFKTRAFNIEDILEIDVTTFRNSLSDDSLSMEWQEMMVEDESSVWVAPKEHENLEEEWGLIQESLLNSMVHIHNQFFGSQNLIDHPGFNKISDADRLLSFLESYKLGASMVTVLPALQSPTLDAQLVPEHLLYVCLEYKEKFGQFRNSARVYNIYKDPNASLMAKTVDPLIALQQRVLFLLNEWPDHPGLQKILDVTEMLLAVPLSTPLAKVLSGLQFLLTKAHQLQENDPKLSISDQMQPILILVSTWQKMELDSWSALLDGVQEQYEINSGKLWFPLYSVLYRGQTVDNSEDIQFTIQSLKEFIQTSSLGEFKRRLQLLLAFHGQISTGICLKYYSCLIEKESSPSPMENMENMQKILYNVFGYYVQFLAVVSEHIETNKRKISADLRELVKLYRWERPDNYLSMETTKRTRQKLKKHIQKFNDVLQQPVMVILNQEAAKRGIKVQSMLEQKVPTDIPESKSVVSPNSTAVNVLNDIERSIWYADWRKKVDFALEYWCPTSLSGFKLQDLRLKDVEEVEGFMRQSHPGCLIYWEEWKELELSLQFICGRIAGSADIWETEKKNNRKRRALSDMLKLLEDRGLSKHRPMISEDILKSNPSSSWFLQPSYNVQHLLLPSGEPTVDDVTSSSQFQTPLNKDIESNWKIANDYYYKSIAMVHFLRQICLNCHKDFNVDQVSRSASFLEHLIEMQQEQRFFAYKFSEDLQSLRKCVYSLTDLHTNHPSNDNEANGESFVALKQKTTRECMWNQKHLFDNLYRISHETSLLLRNVEDTHLNTCQSIKVASNKFLACIEKFVPNIRKSKESLDQYLIGGRRILTTSEAISRPFIVSKQMEQLVMQNFQQINELEQHIQAFSKQDADKRSVEMSLIENFVEVLRKGKVAMQTVYSDDASSDASSGPEVEFAESFNKNLELIREVYQKLGSSTNTEVSLSTNITHWKVLVETFLANMQLDRICKQLGETIARAVQLIDHVGNRNPSECFQIQKCLSLLIVLVDPIMTLGDGFLLEFLSMHKTIAEMTHMLADVFASLYSKGFGGPSEDQTDDNEGDKSQPASGTGLGEGDGVKDVSEQIEDEDQLLGASDKPEEGQDHQNEAHGKDEKGIEMNEDFDAATFSVSEDSEDDENKEDGEDEEPESAMGNTGDDNEVVDEKLWDKEDEGNPETKNEKYESGPSVNDMDSSSRELRAKEDDNATQDDPDELDTDKSEKDGTKNDGDQDENENENENRDDMKLDKDEAVADPTGIEIDDQTHQDLEEDTNMEGPIEEDEATDPMEEVDPDDGNENENENGNPKEDEMTDQPDEEEPGKAESGQLDGNAEGEDPKKDQTEASEMDLVTSTNNSFEQGESNLSGSNVPCSNSGMQMTSESSSSAIPPKEQLSSNGLAPSIGLPLPETDLTLPDSSGGNLTADEPSKPQSEQDKNSSTQRAQPNPYRSVGDALEKWKERVEVSIDANPNEDNADTEAMDDDNADEYGFVPESEKGTNQALGPATQDQVDKNVKGSNIEGDDEEDEGVRQTKIETQKEEEPETLTTETHTALMNKLDEKMKNSNLNEEDEVKEDETLGNIVRDPGSASTSGNLVSMKASYMDEEDEGDEERLEHSDHLSSEIKKLEINNGDNDEAITLWRKYEQITTRLSHELAEQLRLVMEPTLANKLQGDYKTGKRLNMKKVISYIASHYRKDKIWLRRTRPNKRDYQVMVAIDDSRSMSESGCGDVAIEALVTVCRAMSQLEVGQLAVTSFGKKGNIRVLQDFNQQFSSEAGMKMVSSLRFDQENTIRDEPVVDLLQYLGKKMDEASVDSKQLVLIIADGRFHEKERLKRCVRDLLSKDRMVAFLLLDSPDESIMEFMEASFEGESVKFTKYLNSFPFPYYIVLKNIEALPRTLADLLRQWFELMQNTRD